MKRILIALALLALSASAFALETTPLVVKAPVTSKVQTTVGMTRVHTKAANIRVAWLPFLAPLPYSYPRTTQEIPNALVLTGTQIPQRPHREAPNAAVVLARR